MSFYRQMMNSNKDETYKLFLATQERYKNTIKSLLYFSLFGGMLLTVAINAIYGQTTSSLCALVGVAWYILGYQHCAAHWNKEKDFAEFHEALAEYENASRSRSRN